MNPVPEPKRSASLTHAKTFVADGVWATIGSINFDNRSLTLNDESTLMILDENTSGGARA